VPFEYVDYLTLEKFDSEVGLATSEYLNELEQFYNQSFTNANDRKERIINYLDSKHPGYYIAKRQAYHNEAVTDIVRKIYEKNKIIAYKDRLIQQTDPIYEMPWIDNPFDFRAQFYSPVKHFAGRNIDTFWFNMWMVWVMTIGAYVALYYDWLKRFMDLFQK
jgi:hypothetical protein